MLRAPRSLIANKLHLADEAQAAQPHVEHEERINRNSNAVFYDTAATQDADTCRQGPSDEH